MSNIVLTLQNNGGHVPDAIIVPPPKVAKPKSPTPIDCMEVTPTAPNALAATKALPPTTTALGSTPIQLLGQVARRP